MKHAGVLGCSITLLLCGPLQAPGQDAPPEPATPESADSLVPGVPVYSDAPRIIVHAPVQDPLPADPAPPPEPPVFTALSTLASRLPGEGRSITIHRVEPPDLVVPQPPPPPPVPGIDRDSPEFQARMARWREIEGKRKMVALSVTVYDHKLSHIRWTWRDPAVPAGAATPRLRVIPPSGPGPPKPPPPGVVEYEAWSNIDWECMSGVLAVEAGGVRYEMMPGICCVGVDTANRFGRRFTMPAHPELPESPVTFVVTKGDPGNACATALLRAVHAAYPAQAEELWAARAERGRRRREYDEWLKAHPPQPKDITIIYGNIIRPVVTEEEGGEP